MSHSLIYIHIPFFHISEYKYPRHIPSLISLHTSRVKNIIMSWAIQQCNQWIGIFRKIMVVTLGCTSSIHVHNSYWNAKTRGQGYDVNVVWLFTHWFNFLYKTITNIVINFMSYVLSEILVQTVLLKKIYFHFLNRFISNCL